MKRSREDDGAPATPAWSSVCLAVSGSVAAVKAPDIANALLREGVCVDVVVTEAARRLMQATYRGEQPWARLEALVASWAVQAGAGKSETPNASHPPTLRVWQDRDEWDGYQDVGADAVVHVELAKRNQLLLIAPLCANTLAAAALGSCGNLLTSVLRAWYYDLAPEFVQPLEERYGVHAVARPVLVAPAMNTFMWHQRITATHLSALEARSVRVVPPISKRLACGDTGVGAMAEVSDIVDGALRLLREHEAARSEAKAQGKPEFVP